MHPKIVFLLYRKIIMLIFIHLERWLGALLNQGSIWANTIHTLRSSPDFSSQFPRERAACCSKILIIPGAWWALPFFLFLSVVKKAFLLNRNHWEASWTQQEHRAGLAKMCAFGIPECQQWCQLSSPSQHLFVSFQDYNNLCGIPGLPRAVLYITVNKLQNHCHVTDTTISHIKNSKHEEMHYIRNL